MDKALVGIPLVLLLAVLVAGLLGPTIQWAFANIPDPKDLADLPTTLHGSQSHQAATWNAITIASYMSGCPDQVKFICSGSVAHYFCPDPYNAGRLLGLVIGLDGEPLVITGFTARSKYWLDKAACREVQ